jgi:hypothetical protein
MHDDVPTNDLGSLRHWIWSAMPDHQKPSGSHAAVAAPAGLDASLPAHVQSKTELDDMVPRPVRSIIERNRNGRRKEQCSEWRIALACHSPWKAGKSSAYHIDITPTPQMLIISMSVNRRTPTRMLLIYSSHPVDKVLFCDTHVVGNVGPP